MNVQDAKDLHITEGDVRTIHDSSGKQLWGRVNYDTKYAGDIVQQSYTGKNLVNTPDDVRSNGGIDITWVDNVCTFSGTASSTSAVITSSTTYSSNLPQGNYTFSIQEPCAYTVRVAILNADTSNYVNYDITPPATSVQINLNYNAKSLRLAARGWSASDSVSGTITRPMLEAGSSPTSYEPYVGGIASPNPDYPQNIQTVTGEQTITVTDGDLQSQSYTVDLGPIELCKIGTYQDYIYKSGNNWYVHKDCGSITYIGGISENWSTTTSGSNRLFYITNSDTQGGGTSTPVLSNRFIYDGSANKENHIYNNSNKAIVIINPTSNGTLVATTAADFKTWLSTNNTIVYYPLATPTDTQITDSTLITQLNAVEKFLTRYGYSATVSGALPLVINQTVIS